MIKCKCGGGSLLCKDNNKINLIFDSALFTLVVYILYYMICLQHMCNVGIDCYRIIINCLSRHQRPLFVLKGSNFAENVCCRYKQLTCTIIMLSLPDASFMYLCKQSQTYFRRKHQICHQTSAHLKWRLERCHKRQ